MFTGLVEEVGTIDRVAAIPAGRELRVRCGYHDLVAGESVAVNGICLTVRESGVGWFTAAAVVTTLDRTAAAAWTQGTRVNLERALRLGDRLGGHLVQGHVDGVATVVSTQSREDARLIELAVPSLVAELSVPHGSIAVDGVSLTVNDVRPPDIIELSLIAYTLAHTTLGGLQPGDQVNVEGDVIGKFIQRLGAPYLDRATGYDP